jgi:hypothetical protein
MRTPGLKTMVMYATALLIVTHEIALGGVIAPNIPKGTFEMGLQYRRINRQFSSGTYQDELEGSDGSLFIKYGLTRLATLTGEVLILPDIGYRFGDDVEGNWRYYVLGAGLQMTLWERQAWTVEPGFYATETLWFAESNEGCDEKWISLDWVLVGSYSFRWSKITMAIWGGPGYFYIQRTVLASARCGRRVWETDNNWGGTAGWNVLVYGHAQGFFSFVYADNFEPRFGLSYRF